MGPGCVSTNIKGQEVGAKSLATTRLHWPARLSSQLSLLFLCVVYFTTAHADTNVTLDDGDSRITYSPASAWMRTSPSVMDYGGSHMLAETPAATAVFIFTGTAIYFLSPLWPYHVTTQISLDGSAPTLVDLVDHITGRGGAEETVKSQPVWYKTGLENTRHILQISVGAGEPYAIVDGLIYTEATVTTSTTSTNQTPSQTEVQAIGKDPNIPSPTNIPSASIDKYTGLIAGIAVGVVVPLILVVGPYLVLV